MNDPVITVTNVSKKFCRSLRRSMLYGAVDTARAMAGWQSAAPSLRASEFWALKDVNFQVRRGETVGIIGLNGSGKTTLLRLLTGIFPPDEGRIEVQGRVGSLIAVGAGFHPYMTGRENVYLNGTILGMTKAEISERFQSIVDFADVGAFLDTPVSTYSSGMRVRLGFAIAVHCHPDILLMDEVLSVGDIGFRNKSLRRMYEFKSRGNAVLFVSHQMDQVKTLCERVIILNSGGIVYDGPALEGCAQYEESSNERRLEQIRKESMGARETETYEFRQSAGDKVEFLGIGVLDDNKRETEAVGLREPLHYYCDFRVTETVEGLHFSVGITDEKYQPLIWVVNSDKRDVSYEQVSPGIYRLLVTFPEHHLVPGIYHPNIAIRNGGTGETYERAWTKAAFRIKAAEPVPVKERGVIHVDEHWHLVPRAIFPARWSVFERLQPGDVAIDCGANVGDVTAAMVLRGARVYAFEPNPHAYDVLKRRFQGNDRVTCINQGVYDRPAKLPLYLHTDSAEDAVKWSVSSSLVADKKNVDTTRAVEVDLIDLAEFIRSLDRPVALLKLDVEGVEFSILNHLLDQGILQKVGYAVVETHEKQIPRLAGEKATFLQRAREADLANLDLAWM